MWYITLYSDNAFSDALRKITPFESANSLKKWQDYRKWWAIYYWNDLLENYKARKLYWLHYNTVQRSLGLSSFGVFLANVFQPDVQYYNGWYKNHHEV